MLKVVFFTVLLVALVSGYQLVRQTGFLDFQSEWLLVWLFCLIIFNLPNSSSPRRSLKFWRTWTSLSCQICWSQELARPGKHLRATEAWSELLIFNRSFKVTGAVLMNNHQPLFKEPRSALSCTLLPPRLKLAMLVADSWTRCPAQSTRQEPSNGLLILGSDLLLYLL